MLKKLLPVIIFGIFLVGLATPLMVSAQAEKVKECCVLRQDIAIDSQKCGTGWVAAPTSEAAKSCPAAWCDNSAGAWGMFCILNTVFTVTNWMFYILTLIVVIMMIVGGFTILLAHGDSEKANKGRSMLVFAIVGLAIGLLAKAIPSIVRFIMAM